MNAILIFLIPISHAKTTLSLKFSVSLLLTTGLDLLSCLKAQFSSVQSLGHDSLQPHGLEQARLSCPSPTPGVHSDSRCQFSDASSSPPAPNLSQHQSLFQWVSSSHQVAKVLEFQLQHQSFQWIFRVYFLQDWLVWSLCCPRNSQESFPAPQFKSISYLALTISLMIVINSISPLQ